MIVQVEFDSFTRVIERVKEQPMLLRDSDRRNAEPTRTLSLASRPENASSQSQEG